MTITEKITQGRTYLGIELGSVRIKGCLIDDTFTPIADGDPNCMRRILRI